MYEELIAALRFCDGGECDGCCRYTKEEGHSCYALLRDAADAIEELSMKLHGDEAAIAGMKREIERMVVAGKPRWVSVTERLPEGSGDYLVHDSCGNIFPDFFGTEIRRWSARNGMITHWMPLPPAPEPPKEET